METFLKDIKNASRVIATLDTNKKNIVLHQMANALVDNIDIILEKNNIDIENGRRENLTSALMDRLLLTPQRIKDMAKAIEDIAMLKDPVGKTLDGWQNENGLNIQKVSVPIGVIAIIYESRPNVTSDTAALCFKSGNACVLKGGKEAKNSNEAIARILQFVLEKNNLPKELISLLPDYSREGVANLIKQDKYVDLIIPRGGEALIKYVTQNSSVPVIKHDKGVCHTYIDKFADGKKALNIAINAKCQRPGVCNSMETLLIHEEIADILLPGIEDCFREKGTLLKGCEETRKYIDVEIANDEDYFVEYLDNILNIKVVSSVKEAVEHIAIHGSGHSEAIISENYSSINFFLDNVDAACVYANASTRFTDGGAFGFGAEVGISTNKLHSRGPMGINDLTTYKFKIYGNGQVR